MRPYARGRRRLPGVAIIVPADEVIADRRAKCGSDDRVKHLEYEKAFGWEPRKMGRQNPEIRHNF